MIDFLNDHRTTIKAIALTGFGLFYLMISLWLIVRGAREPGTFRHWKSAEGVVVPGRVIFGVFFLFSAFREADLAYNRVIYSSDPTGWNTAITDWPSTIPIVAGVFFGVWTVIRLVRNDVGEQDKERTPALERTADAATRTAIATEELAEQGREHGA